MGSAGMLPACFGILPKLFLSRLTILTPATCRRFHYEIATRSAGKTNRRGNERKA